MNREVNMADMIVSFSVQQQQEVEAIVIDKDGAEALRYLSDLEGIFRSRESHACGPKVAEGPPGHG
ncbi:MAG: hypothetical protein A3K40_05120 [Syntrophobacterales bacterium RIFOXYC2_FULL_60_23]|nr:MAG: hypothetical protein A3K40_05120 [Syntrophobacterales bacterium RIFOXYC2_FULL_60_23]